MFDKDFSSLPIEGYRVNAYVKPTIEVECKPFDYGPFKRTGLLLAVILPLPVLAVLTAFAEEHTLQNAPIIFVIFFAIWLIPGVVTACILSDTFIEGMLQFIYWPFFVGRMLVRWILTGNAYKSLDKL